MSVEEGPRISVVVPVYNSEATLRALHDRLTEVLAEVSLSYEIILVNDKSTDDSWSVIRQLSKESPHLRGIDLASNVGQHAALLAGVRAARNELTVTLDDDLQNPPEEISKLLHGLEPAVDVVYGAPTDTQQAWWRLVGSRTTRRLLSRTSNGAVTEISSYRLFRTNLRDAFVGYDGSNVSLDALLNWGTSAFASVPVRHDRRQAGRSNYSLRKLAVHAVNTMTGFSTLPLRLASLLGFGIALVGIAILVYVITVRLLTGENVPGFAFLASIVSIFAGAQMFALGVIGEYLACVHLRLMGRPAYTIRQVVDGDSQ